jgi:ribosome maturation factor RimP
MTHPLIPPLLELASPIATSLDLEVVGAVFQTNQSPPVLRLEIRNPAGEVGLDECERMSRALDTALDEVDLIPGAYVLEVSSPGVPRTLTSDREFLSFRGFPVAVITLEPIGGLKEHQGNLVRRDEESVCLNKKGRMVKIPRSAIDSVQLIDGAE